FLIFSSLSNDSFIILSSFARFGKLFLNFFICSFCLPQTACITLQAFLLFVNPFLQKISNIFLEC
ncbi:MAG: hypothetical protein SPI42_06580, partial [Lactobacillus johnsonii]|nr:hypothetical protein [Lactobacillus johnsonii]MDY6195792.1 hypothetical protein [Lactobacillus johnsonii]